VPEPPGSIAPARRGAPRRHPLKPICDWVKNYGRSWSEHFDRLDVVLAELTKWRTEMVTVTSSGTAVVTLG
jgi:hypothetical protein